MDDARDHSPVIDPPSAGLVSGQIWLDGCPWIIRQPKPLALHRLRRDQSASELRFVARLYVDDRVWTPGKMELDTELE
jgi:hypothetical protein